MNIMAYVSMAIMLMHGWVWGNVSTDQWGNMEQLADNVSTS